MIGSITHKEGGTVSGSNSASGGGIGFVGLLTILFVALKLTGVIAWSWWWVVSPVWITTVLVVAVLICAAVVIERSSTSRGRLQDVIRDR